MMNAVPAAPKLVTLGDLERAIARLKLANFFSFGQGALNEPHGQCDVFPDVDDLGAFDPTDEGDASAFLAWERAAGEAAFDARGVLTLPLPVTWGGSFAALQTAFAEAGLTVRIDLDEAPREPYGESGRLVLSPRSGNARCDLLALLDAFAGLESKGIVALANAGYTQSEGWEDVAERSRGGDQTAVFWHAQKHDAFDGVGNLSSPLLLHWRGDADAIISGLRAAGFVVRDAPPESRCLEVTSGPTGDVDLESYGAAVEAIAAACAAHAKAARRGRPRAKGRAVRGHTGPLEAVHAFRGRDRQPVRRLAFDPQRPERIAFAQGLDTRGFPTAPGYIVDLATGGVERAFLPDARAMGVGGLRFLPDGRLLFCTTQLRRLGPDDRAGTSCLVLHAWSPAGSAEEEIFCQAFSHISETALLAFDGRASLAALGQPDGVDVYVIPPPGDPWPAPQRLRIAGEPVRAYTRTAVSPDGALVAWCDDWSAPLACFDRAAGALRWRHEPAMRAKSQIAFTPDSFAVALLEGRSGESRTVHFYAAADGRAQHHDLTAATDDARCFAFHPGGRLLAVGGAAGVVRLFDFPGPAVRAEVKVLAKGDVSALAFTADGVYLAVGGTKGDVALYRLSG